MQLKYFGTLKSESKQALYLIGTYSFTICAKVYEAICSPGYQYWLIYGGLNTYLLSNQRGSDMISQNKEGLFSIFGEHQVNLSASFLPGIGQTFNPLLSHYIRPLIHSICRVLEYLSYWCAVGKLSILRKKFNCYTKEQEKSKNYSLDSCCFLLVLLNTLSCFLLLDSADFSF